MGSNARSSSSDGFLCYYWTTYSWNLVNEMLIISTFLIGGFIFAALLSEDVSDDDDHFGGGMMQPLQIPSNNPT